MAELSQRDTENTGDLVPNCPHCWMCCFPYKLILFLRVLLWGLAFKIW